MEQLKERLERAAKTLGIQFEEETAEKLFIFLGELSKWNKAYNLVGRKTNWDDLVEHCIDALSVMLVTDALPEGTRAVDIGSGAGFPGVPVYLAAGPFKLVLLEVVRKKLAFLRHIKRIMDLQELEIMGMRAEEAVRGPELRESFDVAMMRAVADWRKALPLAKGFLREEGAFILLAGRIDAEDMAKAKGQIARAGYELVGMRSSKRLTGRETAVLKLKRLAPEARKGLSP